MILLLLTACGTPKPQDSADLDPSPTGDELTVSPAALDFGVVGAPAEAVLTVSNHGAGQVSLGDLSAGSPDLTVETSTEEIPPGGAAELTVRWAPAAPTVIADTLRVLTLSSASGPGELEIPVSGTADWGSIGLTAAAVDLGTVKVGCDAETEVTVSNLGTSDLVVDSLALASGVDFKLSAVDGELPAFPWTLAPGTHQTALLVYTPLDQVEAQDTVLASSNDPITPQATVEVSGIGTIEAQNAIEYTVIERQASLLYFAMNESAICPTAGHGTQFRDALPALFEALDALGFPYRAGFTTQTTVDSLIPVDYLDESVDAGEAAAMLEDALPTAVLTDNDYLLATFGEALKLHGDWMFDEGGIWDDAKLNLIGINYDLEQSPAATGLYVADYRTYRDDPRQVLVHAIAGPMPRGCGGAVGSEKLDEAVTETGGVFLEFCDSDWTDHMTALAEAAEGDHTDFVLTGDPAAWSIEVTIDGVDTPEGWTYDEDSQEVIFDADAYPEAGAVVRIAYIMATTCEG